MNFIQNFKMNIQSDADKALMYLTTNNNVKMLERL